MLRGIAVGGGVVWKKDLGGSGEGLASIQVDPLDRRVLCLAGTRGSLTVLKLVQPAKDRCDDSSCTWSASANH